MENTRDVSKQGKQMVSFKQHVSGSLLEDLSAATFTVTFFTAIPPLVQRFYIWSCQKGFCVLIATKSEDVVLCVLFSELLFLHY